jgi:hypothetical protein
MSEGRDGCHVLIGVEHGVVQPDGKERQWRQDADEDDENPTHDAAPPRDGLAFRFGRSFVCESGIGHTFS